MSGADDEACPGCGDTTSSRPSTGTPPVQAWACAACQTRWAITTVNPQPYLDRFAATVERLSAARSIPRRVRALADETPTITNERLADRLRALP